MIGGVSVRNVNEALEHFIQRTDYEVWRDISPRGLKTLEHKGLFVTEYERPNERVLFSAARDANPFFHFFESLWILDGREDVDYLVRYNRRMAEFSDDGRKFHAAYGKRLRRHFLNRDLAARSSNAITDSYDTDNYHPKIDQILTAINLLKEDHATRQVVMSIWDPEVDLGVRTKDMPCNDLVMLKIRDGKLNITVACRSNDIIWGAYGANAVQFSMLQEFVARAVGVGIGAYYQVSDSFHVYTDNPTFKKLVSTTPERTDHYESGKVDPYPIMNEVTSPEKWLAQLRAFNNDESVVMVEGVDSFFKYVASPMAAAWRTYQHGVKNPTAVSKNTRIDQAIHTLRHHCAAQDWQLACVEWLERRRQPEEDKQPNATDDTERAP